MNIAIIVLAILYLVGFGVGKALAICAIIYAGLVTFVEVVRKM